VPPVEVAMATQPETAFRLANLLLLGVALLALAGAIFFLMRRRTRAAVHASLITRSMNRDQK